MEESQLKVNLDILKPRGCGATAPWFGGKRSLAAEICAQVGKHRAYYELGCGSLAPLLAKPECALETACDLHGDLTNLAWVIQSDAGAELYERLQRTLMVDDILDFARGLLTSDPPAWSGFAKTEHVDRAWAFFVSCWCGRNGVAGLKRCDFQMAVRWTPGGGHGGVRFRSAVESLPWLHNRLRRVLILRRDMFDVLPRIDDVEGVAIYLDPPYVNDGKTRTGHGQYLYDFAEVDHVRLAAELRRFKVARVLVSYYDNPKIDTLYEGWSKLALTRQKHLHVQNRRGAGRCEALEVLLVNGELNARPGGADTDGEE